jgi:hypothetical protein
MEKKTAQEMRALLEKFEQIFDEAELVIANIDDEAEARAIRRLWGDMLSLSYELSVKTFEVDPSLRPPD